MPFRFINTFQCFLLDQFLIAYLNDILIFSEDPDQHSFTSRRYWRSCTSMDFSLSWKAPQNMKVLQRFLQFASFYRWFITNFVQVVVPFTTLLCKNVQLEAQPTFEYQKQAFTSSLVFAHSGQALPFAAEMELQ